MQDVSIAYQVPNLAPSVKGVKIVGLPDAAPTPAAGGDGEAEAPKIPAARRQAITWEAADPNSDALQYTVAFRRAGDAEAPWVTLRERTTELTYEWDTRAVADGRYEVRVTASDALANVAGTGKTAARVSDAILIDNTPPVLGDVKSSLKGDVTRIEFRVVDRTDVLAAAEYSVDSSKAWQAILPSDNIWDGPEESAGFDVPGLKPGTHQVTIRVTDSKGNQAFENVFVAIPQGRF